MIINNEEVVSMAKKEKLNEKQVEVQLTEEQEKQKLNASLDVIDLNQNETLESFTEKIEKGRDDFYKTFSKQILKNFLNQLPQRHVAE